jgi:hypothetical protein
MAKRKQKDVYLIAEPDWGKLLTIKDEEKRREFYRGCEYFVHYEIADKKAMTGVWHWLDKHSGFDKELIKKLKKVPDVWFGTFSKHCYIHYKSGYMPDDVAEHLKAKVPDLENKAEEIIEAKEEQQKNKAPVVSIQQRMREQVVDLCGEWEHIIDQVCLGEFDVKSFDPYKDMLTYGGSKVIKPNHAKIIKDMYTQQHSEAIEIAAWKDEDIKEAYNYMSAKVRKDHLALFDKIMTACDTLINTGKAQRKTRKPKAVSKEKVIAKLKYQVNDSDLGIASINPVEIIDAKELWVYNTKTRKVGVYKVDGLKVGLGVKGTSIVDFDPVKSVQKTLRKPAEQIKAFVGARTKVSKAFDEVKTTDTKLNGRFNEHTIILKAF